MLPKQECLNCKRLLWDDAPIDKIEIGTEMVCAFCGHVARLDENFKLVNTDKISDAARKDSDFIKYLISLGIKEEQIHNWIMIK